MASPIAVDLELPLTIADDGPVASLAPDDAVLHLFDEFAPVIWRQVRGCGLAPDAADDVVQETFLALHRHLRRGGGRDNLRGWLVRVGYRQALKRRERQARSWRREAAWPHDLAGAIIDATPRVDQQMVELVERRRRRAVFNALPERDRRCVSLRAEGLRYRAIASALGMSLGLVAKTLARAAAKLARAEGAV